ncbi:MAG: RNA polymerase subunit sigma-24 [Isosphaeraceae bacterium]
MPECSDFQELIRLARAGDEVAAARLAHEFEPFIRRFVRFRMRQRSNHDRLRPEIDSADICQSIFKSLFVGLREGRFELNRPEQLAKLLSAMVRFKVATKARRLSVTLREILELDAPMDRADSRPGPEKVVDDRDALETILKLFEEDELELLIRRLDDQPWPTIALAVGGTAEGLRKKLTRAIERVRDHPELHDVFDS